MFEVGKRYRVTYTYDHWRNPRQFVGTYLGEGYLGGHDFSLRPLGGTSTILTDAEIIESEEVTPRVPHELPTPVARHGNR